MTHARTLALLVTSCGLMSGCFGDSGSAVIAPTNESPGGIWTGTDSQTGLPVTGLVTESGQFHFVRKDGTQYVGTVTTSGMSGSGSFDGFAPPGTTFADGSIHGIGTVSGTVHQRSAFTATTQFTTDAGSPSSDTLSMTYNTLYDRPSSLATVAGTFTEQGTGTVFSIDANGMIFAQAGSCVISGAVTIIDATYNAYRVSVSYANCAGQYPTLNGVTLTGLGSLDNSVSPERAVLGLSGTAGTTKLAIWDVLDRS